MSKDEPVKPLSQTRLDFISSLDEYRAEVRMLVATLQALLATEQMKPYAIEKIRERLNALAKIS